MESLRPVTTNKFSVVLAGQAEVPTMGTNPPRKAQLCYGTIAV